LDYVEPQEEIQPKIAMSHIEGEHIENYGDNPMTNVQAKIYINRLLDDEKFPLWRIQDMYLGIEKDKDLLTTEELAQKYGMTPTRITGIIKMLANE
jgi:hypothetical protein